VDRGAGRPVPLTMAQTGEAYWLTEDRPADWSPTRAFRRAVGLVCLLLVVAVVLARADLLVIAVPFVVATAVALLRPPRGVPAVGIAVDGDVLAEGEPLSGRVMIDASPCGVGIDVAVIRSASSPWLQPEHGSGGYAVTLDRGEVVELAATGIAGRWGRHALGPATARATACDGLLASRDTWASGREVIVHPQAPAFVADDAMPRAAGMTGVHRSRRPGEGGELAGVRPFTPGDRLRRIDWRVTLRARELYVSSTLSERDADVVVVVDALHDVGRSTGFGGVASSLDTAVRAAAAMTAHYVVRGDRVSLVEYGPRLRVLPPAAGRRHHRAALDWLTNVRVLPEGADPGPRMLGPQVLPPRALLLFLTPLVDPRSTHVLASLAQHGRSLVAVDTLPSDARPDGGGRWADAAWRLWLVEREHTVGRLWEVGVPVVRWRGTGSLDEVLRDVSRMAAGPRAIR